MSTDSQQPLITTQFEEDWIDHEFLFHNAHVKKIGHNTVSISGNGITKTILRPGKGHYPLPKSACTIDIVGRVQETGEVFQNSRDIQSQQAFLSGKREGIFARQMQERQAKNDKELAEHKDDPETTAKLCIRHEKERAQHETDFAQSSRDDDRDTLFLQPTSFQFGEKELVRGLELAIATMRVGELSKITCSAQYAYSDIGIEDFIPDNAVVEYEVELLSAEAAAVQIYPGVMKKYVQKGEGWTTPEYNTTCSIFIEGRFACDPNYVTPESTNIEQIGQYTTKQFLHRTEYPLEARIDDLHLPEGLEQCLKSMKKGEIALFEINKNLLIGNGFEPKRHSSPLPIHQGIPSSKPDVYGDVPEIPDDLVVFYLIELVDIAHHVETWSLKLEERVIETERIKEVANEFLRLGVQNNQIIDVPASYTLKNQIGYFQRAIERYEACLDIYEHFAEYEQRQCTYEQIMRVIAVQLACYNNLQIIFMKYKDYKKTVEVTTKAIELIMTPVDIYQQDLEESTQQNEDQSNEDHPKAYSTPSISTKTINIGKSFPPQTKTNNLFKTMYRKAQALLLLNDVEGSKKLLDICFRIWDERTEFNQWKADNNINMNNPKQQIHILYKEQPLLNNSIIPVKYQDEETNKEELYPLNFDVIDDAIKKEVDKLFAIVDKKFKAAKQKSKAQWAKAFGNDDEDDKE